MDSPKEFLSDLWQLILRLAVLALVVGGVLFWALNSAWLTGKIAMKYLGEGRPGSDSRGVVLKAIDVGKQRFRFPQHISFEGLKAELQNGAQTVFVTAERIDVTGFRSFFGESGMLDLNLHNVAVRAGGTELSDGKFWLQLALDEENRPAVTGKVIDGTVVSGPYRLEQIESRLVAGYGRLTLTDLTGRWAGGTVKGKVLVNFVPYLNCTAEITLADVPAKAMGDAGAKIFDQMRGSIDGEVRVEGRMGRISDLRGSLTAPSIELESGLVLQMLQLADAAGAGVIAQLGEERVQQLGRALRYVPFQTAQITVVNFNKDTMQALLTMNSRDLNLNLELTLDIRVAGGIDGLLRVMEVMPRK